MPIRHCLLPPLALVLAVEEGGRLSHHQIGDAQNGPGRQAATAGRVEDQPRVRARVADQGGGQLGQGRVDAPDVWLHRHRHPRL